MRARNVLSGEIFEAEWRTDVSSSSYGQPVLCIKHKDGRLEPVDDWAFEVVEEGKGTARPCPFNRRKRAGDLFDPRD